MKRSFITLLILLALIAVGCTTTGSGTATAKKKAIPAVKEVYAFGFETGDAGDWKPKGPVKLEVTDAAAHEGKKSLAASGRSETWHAPEMDVLPVMEAAGMYEVTCWVRLFEGAEEASVKMTVEVVAEGVKNWVQICQPVTAKPGEWVQLNGEFECIEGLEKAGLYIEPLDPSVSFYVDDIKIVMQGE